MNERLLANSFSAGRQDPAPPIGQEFILWRRG